MTVTIHRKGDYQDIREELRKRINLLERMMTSTQERFTAEQEKAALEHKTAMDGYKATIASYRTMLELEESFARSILRTDSTIGPQQEQSEVEITIPKAKASLADFLIAQIGQRGAMSKEDLRLAALYSDYFGHGESGGRAVHATLINLIRNKRLSVSVEGLYSLAPHVEEERML